MRDITYRPSIRRTFLKRYNTLDINTKNYFQDYASTTVVPSQLKELSKNQQAYFLDTAMDLYDMKNSSTDLNKVESKEKNYLLKERANVDFVTEDLKIIPDLKDEPAKSHASSRLGFSYFDRDGQNFSIYSYRFALHDLLDQQTGLPRNSQLEFFNFKFLSKENKFSLYDFSFFRVMNLNPINFFEKKPSWGVDVGIENKNHLLCASKDNCYLYGGLFKYGYSSSWFQQQNMTSWWLLTANTRYSDSLEGTKDYVAIGFELGLLYRWSDYQAISTQYSMEFPYKKEQLDRSYVEYRYSIGNKYQLGFSYENKNKNQTYGLLGYIYL